MKFLKTAWSLAKQTFKNWSDDKAPRLGAALSYYTVFSLAPVLILVISIAGLAFGQEAAQGRIMGQLSGLIGAQGAEVVQTMVAKANDRGAGVVSTIIGAVMLLVGATGVLIELQDALNFIWKVETKPGAGIKNLIRERLLSFGLILVFGFLLLVSLVLSAALAALGGLFSRWIPGWVILGYVLNYAVALGVITTLFALIYKILPDVRIPWKDVWMGAFVTSVLFQVGKFAIGLYLGKASVGSAFGAAGSLAVLLVWIYYSSQLILLGAEFTHVWAMREGTHVVATENAVPAPVAGAPAPASGSSKPANSGASRPPAART